MYSRRAEAFANDYKHFMSTLQLYIQRTDSCFLLMRFLLKFVPGSAGDLGSKIETRKLIKIGNTFSL